MSDEEEKENSNIFTFKLVTLGEAGVGTTSISTTFVNGKFNEFEESTIGGIININFSNLFNSNY
jgi:GTPase SAR1 family protein